MLESTGLVQSVGAPAGLLASPAPRLPRGPERPEPGRLTFVCFCFWGWKAQMLSASRFREKEVVMVAWERADVQDFPGLGATSAKRKTFFFQSA